MAHPCYSLIDLFAGCGGFSVGFESQGFVPRAHVEIDNWACETLRANFPDSHVLQADIRRFEDSDIALLGPADVLIGGPPCQGFSVAGPTQFGVDDPRNDLAFVFLHWACLLQPKIVIIENVPAMLNRRLADEGTVVDVARKRLRPLGYTITTHLLNAADFGVPQLRRRAFIVAVASGLTFRAPEPSHGSEENLDLFTRRVKYTTVKEALSDLPPLNPGEGADEAVPYATAPSNVYQERMRSGSHGVTNHIAMRHTARLVERFRQIKPGQSLKDVAREYGQKRNLSGEIHEKPYKYNNYRLSPDAPSLAIPAAFQSLFIHPHQDRNLTAREAARLMSFPDVFCFRGKRTTMSWEKSLSQYYQIGNAVCPAVAAALGRSARECLERAGVVPLVGPSQSATVRATRDGTAFEAFEEGLGADVLTCLGDAASRMATLIDLQPDAGGGVTLDGLLVPAATLPAAMLIATERDCPLCRSDLKPHASHDGAMAFLISKEDLESLLVNENEHGLDFHLRSVFGIPMHCGHVVGEALSKAGLATLTEVTNPRTGRKVRGIRVANCPPWVERVRPILFGALRARRNRGASHDPRPVG